MTTLGERVSRFIAEATALKCGAVGLANAEKNRPFFGKTIDDLPGISNNPAGSAIVVVGGPSLHRKDTAVKILAGNFKGDIVTADGSLAYCLRKGLVPNYVLCLDPHPYRIARWFGDTELAARPDDDYFRRQDLDPEHWANEIRCNDDIIHLVNEYGSKIKAILCTSVDPVVTKRCLEAGMEIYWWNPMTDDPDQPESATRKLVETTGIPCMMTGGNVGTAAWIFSYAVLRRKHVALAGMDLGYAPGTPFLNTQYYYELVELFGERANEAFIHVHNPHIDETWFTDPTYFWYRTVFLDLVREASCITYNCTEGGTLFGEGINFMPLTEWLTRFSDGAGG